MPPASSAYGECVCVCVCVCECVATHMLTWVDNLQDPDMHCVGSCAESEGTRDLDTPCLEK